MRLPDRLHHGADAEGQGGRLRGRLAPGPRRLALTLVSLAAVLLAGLAASPVLAHSLLLESVPGAETTLPAAPERLTLRFNNRVEKRLCKVRLGPPGAPAHELPIVTAEGAADTLVAALPPLAPGPYRVQWQVLSTDGHIVTGAFSFRLGR